MVPFLCKYLLQAKPTELFRINKSSQRIHACPEILVKHTTLKYFSQINFTLKNKSATREPLLILCFTIKLPTPGFMWRIFFPLLLWIWNKNEKNLSTTKPDRKRNFLLSWDNPFEIARQKYKSDTHKKVWQNY